MAFSYHVGPGDGTQIGRGLYQLGCLSGPDKAILERKEFEEVVLRVAAVWFELNYNSGLVLVSVLGNTKVSKSFRVRSGQAGTFLMQKPEHFLFTRITYSQKL